MKYSPGRFNRPNKVSDQSGFCEMSVCLISLRSAADSAVMRNVCSGISLLWSIGLSIKTTNEDELSVQNMCPFPCSFHAWHDAGHHKREMNTEMSDAGTSNVFAERSTKLKLCQMILFQIKLHPVSQIF